MELFIGFLGCIIVGGAIAIIALIISKDKEKVKSWFSRLPILNKLWFRWSIISLGCVVLILFLNKPVRRDFDDFIEINSIDCNCNLIASQTSDYFVYSVYSYRVIEKKKHGDPIIREEGAYYGFFRNFYLISNYIYPKPKNYYH